MSEQWMPKGEEMDSTLSMFNRRPSGAEANTDSMGNDAAQAKQQEDTTYRMKKEDMNPNSAATKNPKDAAPKEPDLTLLREVKLDPKDRQKYDTRRTYGAVGILLCGIGIPILIYNEIWKERKQTEKWLKIVEGGPIEQAIRRDAAYAKKAYFTRPKADIATVITAWNPDWRKA